MSCGSSEIQILDAQISLILLLTWPSDDSFHHGDFEAKCATIKQLSTLTAVRGQHSAAMRLWGTRPTLGQVQIGVAHGGVGMETEGRRANAGNGGGHSIQSASSQSIRAGPWWRRREASCEWQLNQCRGTHMQQKEGLFTDDLQDGSQHSCTATNHVSHSSHHAAD